MLLYGPGTKRAGCCSVTSSTLARVAATRASSAGARAPAEAAAGLPTDTSLPSTASWEVQNLARGTGAPGHSSSSGEQGSRFCAATGALAHGPPNVAHHATHRLVLAQERGHGVPGAPQQQAQGAPTAGHQPVHQLRHLGQHRSPWQEGEPMAGGGAHYPSLIT